MTKPWTFCTIAASSDTKNSGTACPWRSSNRMLAPRPAKTATAKALSAHVGMPV